MRHAKGPIPTCVDHRNVSLIGLVLGMLAPLGRGLKVKTKRPKKGLTVITLGVSRPVAVARPVVPVASTIGVLRRGIAVTRRGQSDQVTVVLDGPLAPVVVSCLLPPMFIAAPSICNDTAPTS